MLTLRRLCSVSTVAALAATVGGCSSASLPSLSPGQPKLDTASVSAPAASPANALPETRLIAPGLPTDVYALVARGALGCWFGADGLLKPTHVFQADAKPPSKGGDAEIVIHERDVTLRDQRGVRAFRVSFAGVAEGVRIVIEPIRMAPPLGSLMVKDVEVWAKGGSGCELRALAPPPQAVAQPSPKAPVRTGAARSNQR